MPRVQEAMLLCMHCSQPIKNSAVTILDSAPTGAMIDFYDNSGSKLRMLLHFAPEPEKPAKKGTKSK